ncbi:hypothetical protein GJ699_11755 [Duganella sp. FT80W]|uniref:Uncharacterized protein n=1 Tax=Duganella guangzhouensis TaxID=2666084 RepID=A0A6I2L1L9_9BURK|nr:hypothetical protein [Duganella guangzhouensis]MRW90664.1 hypothetical protein [Duganella guangzhouensis]
MNLKARLHSLPLPVSTIALLAAFVLGNLEYQSIGWALFGFGVLAWVKLDAQQLLRADRYGLSPALALLAYPALAGDQANVAVTFALALHALVVFLILMSRHLSEDITQAFSQQKDISHRI